MDFLKLYTEHLHDPRFITASDRARGSWLAVLLYCAAVENGGRVLGLLTWRPAQVRMILRTSLAGIRAAVEAGLMSFDGDDLVATGYDHDAQARLAVMRAQGAHGAKGGRPAGIGSTPAPVPAPEPMEGVKGSQDGTQMRGDGDRTRPEGTGREGDPAAARLDHDQVVTPGTATAGTGPAMETQTSPGGFPGGPGLTGAVTTGPEPTPGPEPTRPAEPAGPDPRIRFDRPGATAALEAGDLLGLVRALGGNLAGDRVAEWNREADGLSVGTVAAILGWRRLDGDPVREPSGFRAARGDWRALPAADRAMIGARVGERLGLALRCRVAVAVAA